MWFRKTVACGLAVLSAQALPAAAQGFRRPRCGNEPPTREQMAIAANLSRIEGVETLQSRSDIPDSIVVPVHFHVLAASQSVEDGYLTDVMLSDQLRVLNEDFAPHNISFDLQSTTFTINSTWSADGDFYGMRETLRRGGYDTLNLYFMGTMEWLGYCTLPGDAVPDPSSEDFIADGCAVIASSVPGGSFDPYNLGRTATHEVGHWFNLWHTFEGGCGCVGDMILDTPAEARDHYGCPVGQDSCPDRPGLDPLNNFMSYYDDACMEEFTIGQAVRMRAAWYNLRGGKPAPPPSA